MVKRNSIGSTLCLIMYVYLGKATSQTEGTDLWFFFILYRLPLKATKQDKKIFSQRKSVGEVENLNVQFKPHRSSSKKKNKSITEVLGMLHLLRAYTFLYKFSCQKLTIFEMNESNLLIVFAKDYPLLKYKLFDS